MIFHIIFRDDADPKVRMLSEAAARKGVEVNKINAEKVTFRDLPTISEGDILYRCSPGVRGTAIERFLLRPGIGHIYQDSAVSMGGYVDSFFCNNRERLPVILTVPFLPVSDQDMQDCVDDLGGFPIVVKANGNQNGVGVMRLDSWESLRSVVDFLVSAPERVWFRKYIPHVYQARLAVLSDKVLAAHKNFSSQTDFRTNVKVDGRKREVFEPDEEMKRVALAAVASTGKAFGGIDLLVQESGEFYIAEVNTPFGFDVSQDLVGVDIAGALIDYLISRT